MSIGSSSAMMHDSGDNVSLLVSLPLLVPYGVVVKSDSSSSAVYAFSTQFPSARTLFSRSSGTSSCDMFVGQLQVDLVSFSCKRNQVAQVASVFNRMARKKLQQLFERPIYIRCEGLKQRSVSPVGVGGSGASQQQVMPHDVFIGSGQQRVYFTSVDILTNLDRESFWAIESFVESYVEKLRELRLMNPKTVARTPDLFIVVRRFLSDPLPHPLNYYSQYVCDGVQLSEVRLVFSKGTSQCPVKHLKIDPRFKNIEISCRPIVCDSDGRPARHEFAQAILPPVFGSATAAASYLESLSLEDDREARQFLLEGDSRSGSSNDGIDHTHIDEDILDDSSASAVDMDSVQSSGIRSVYEAQTQLGLSSSTSNENPLQHLPVEQQPSSAQRPLGRTGRRKASQDKAVDSTTS